MPKCVPKFEDAVANAVLRKFNALPRKCKPAHHQWIPLSGIVLTRGEDAEPECVALGYNSSLLDMLDRGI